MRRVSVLFVVSAISLLCIGSAQALPLDLLNVSQRNATARVIDASGSLMMLAVQWTPGAAANTPGALGIDDRGINGRDTSLAVVRVYVDASSAANSVTSSWLPTNGGSSAGGGFAAFVESFAEPAPERRPGS